MKPPRNCVQSYRGFMAAKDKTRNGGEWTESRFQSFIKSTLRAGSRRWPPRFKCLNAAKVGKKINASSGRLAEHYRCAGCGKDFPAKEVQVDHINSIVSTDGFTTWDDVIYNLFCEADGLQVLCKPCHSVKSKEENALRRLNKNNNK